VGLVYSNIKLSNPVLPNLASLETSCLVDTVATYLCIPMHIANQLELKTLQEREVTFASGESTMVPYVGPIQINVENRIYFAGAMVLGNECLLGAIPIEDMDLIVYPKLLKLAVNPDNLNTARGIAKGLPKSKNN
jgi:clan AA aspartic protease